MLDPDGKQAKAGASSFPQCEKNCHGFCFELTAGKISSCKGLAVTQKGCPFKIGLVLGLVTSNQICNWAKGWVKSKGFLPFKHSSCRQKKGVVGVGCECTNRKPFGGKASTITFNDTITAEQLIPSPLTPEEKKWFEDQGYDLTDPSVLKQFRTCSLTLKGSINFTNSKGWIGQCTQKKAK